MKIRIKRAAAALSAFLILITLGGCLPQSQKLVPADAAAEAEMAPSGRYTASAQGYGGTVRLVVTLQGGILEKIEVEDNDETKGIGSLAIETLPLEILKNQSLAVDCVAGATVTSRAIIEAVGKAVKRAGLSPETMQLEAEIENQRTARVVQTDIVVIGAGAAGMTAAISAHDLGTAKVALVEKESFAGGSSRLADDGVNAAYTDVQRENGISDSIELFLTDTIVSGHEINDTALAEVLTENSAGVIEWLKEAAGAVLDKVILSEGSSHERTHVTDEGNSTGEYISEKLINAVHERDIPLYLGAAATEIVLDENGAVAGVCALSQDTSYYFDCKAVIIATGGFGANSSMIISARPAYRKFAPLISACADGSGIEMARNVGAATVDMEHIQLWPAIHKGTGTEISGRLFSYGAILVNAQGERFANETGKSEGLCETILEQTGGFAYLIYDSEAASDCEAAARYLRRGIAIKGESAADLAQKLALPPDVLEATLDDWQKIKEAGVMGRDIKFGREILDTYAVTTPPFYALKVAPGIVSTMGGVKIDAETRVEGADGEAIAGLFAAGEVTGAVHGDGPLAGSRLTDAMVFGKVAASSAALYCEEQKALKESEQPLQ